MRLLFVTSLLCSVTSLAADFTLTLVAGEASRDASSLTRTYAVVGATLTRTMAADGVGELQPGRKCR